MLRSRFERVIPVTCNCKCVYDHSEVTKDYSCHVIAISARPAMLVLLG
jgi:hypothetical protein